jgi:hypothetical protein
MSRKSYIALLGFIIATFIVGMGARSARAQDMGGMGIGGMEMGNGEADAKTPPPILATGEWCGPLTDMDFGKGGFFITFTQKSRKLSGTWFTNIKGFIGGTFTGHIDSDGETVVLKLKQPKAKGGFMVFGTFVNNHNMTGNYSTFGRKTSDSGSLNPESPCI